MSSLKNVRDSKVRKTKTRRNWFFITLDQTTKDIVGPNWFQVKENNEEIEFANTFK